MTQQKQISLTEIQQLICREMAEVDNNILAQFQSDIPLINQVGAYIIQSGGKRIRPLLTLLAGKALNANDEPLIQCASFVEFIHTATLLHDDVIDESDLRRGNPTANAKFGNSASVLVGDFIYTRAFQMIASLQSQAILNVMTDATNAITEGEVQQLINCNNPNTTEADYMNVIYSKTARLFEVATQCACILAKGNAQQEEALKYYGRYLGTAFQLVDDVLDYRADSQALGKNIGDDFVEGKPTLPLLHAMHHGNAEQKAFIHLTIQQGGNRTDLPKMLNIMAEHHSLDYTMQQAHIEAKKAINAIAMLPDTPYKQALISLAYLSVNRQH